MIIELRLYLIYNLILNYVIRNNNFLLLSIKAFNLFLTKSPVLGKKKRYL